MTLREKLKEIRPDIDDQCLISEDGYCPCEFQMKDSCDDGLGDCEKCWNKEYVEDKVEPANDPVNRPAHYTDGKIEVIEFIEDKKLGFCLGNAVKYIARAGKKDPTKTVEDLKKAKWYIERRIKELEGGASNDFI